MEWPSEVIPVVLALLDDARALATCACVSSSWRAVADAERGRLRAAYVRELGEDDGAAFFASVFSREDPQALRQAGWRLSARLAYHKHRRRCLAALRTEADEAAADRGARLLAAHAFVQANAHRFRKPVYGPLLTEIAFAEPWHAACVADECPPFIWQSFLINYSDEDNEGLCRQLARFGVCVTFFPAEEVPEEPAEPWAESLLDATSLVQAPPPVMRALCDVGGLRMLPVAEADDVMQAAQVLHRSSARALLALLPVTETAGHSREAWRLCAAPRAGEQVPMPMPRCARVPDAPPVVLAALGQRADWCAQ